jgi:phage terminase small subunit
MPILKKVRYELFAQEVAKGLSQTQAAIVAGYSVNDADSRGSKLAARPDIRARVEELRPRIDKPVTERAAFATGITKASVLQELLKLAERAKQEKQLSVARRCYGDRS